MQMTPRIAPPFLRSLTSGGKIWLLAAAMSFSMLRPAWAVSVTSDEMADARQWIAATFEGTADAKSTVAPFSFIYDGKPSAEVLKGWTLKRESQKLDAGRVQHTLTYTDSKTGLVARCAAIEYLDFPTVEWTLYLKNTSAQPTPIVSEYRAIDTLFHRGAGDMVLYHNAGSPAAPIDYKPEETPLPPKAFERIATSGGRSTNTAMPYFNIASPGRGIIVVLGWPGQWAAQFVRDEKDGVTVQGGQELTHFELLPGEEVRSPLAVVQFYRGDHFRGQNIWRRWMNVHNLPQPGGKPMPPASMVCTSDNYPGMKSSAAGEINYINQYIKANAKPDYWWIDAGWYPCTDWPNIGTWEPDPTRYPKGIREVADKVHANGMKLVVWFEPERVTAGTWLTKNHPDWVLGGAGGGLLNFGNPDAWKWIVEHVDKLIVSEGIDLYRQDFNMDPLGYWRGNDKPDRQGITEIKHVVGFLAYWDELRRRHPSMPIDTCASGGRRNDLETLRRSFPLLRSDYRFEPAGTQGHTFGMASWIPYYGTGVYAVNNYVFRSHWCPWLGAAPIDIPGKGPDWENYRRMSAELRSVAPLYAGDYYPLTSYNLAGDAWVAWQFDCPEKGEGLVQAFAHDATPYRVAQFKLHGLDAGATYEFTDMDSHATTKATGRDVMEKGLRIEVAGPATAPVITYKRAH